MEVICYGLGIITGGAAVYFFCKKDIKKKEETLDAEIKSYHRVTTQFTNFLNYNGSSEGQEDVD